MPKEAEQIWVFTLPDAGLVFDTLFRAKNINVLPSTSLSPSPLAAHASLTRIPASLSRSLPTLVVPQYMPPSANLLVPRIHRANRTRPLARQSRVSLICACRYVLSLPRIGRLSLDHSALRTTRASRNAIPRPLTRKSHCSPRRIPPLSTTSASTPQLNARRNQHAPHATRRARTAHLNAATQRNDNSVILAVQPRFTRNTITQDKNSAECGGTHVPSPSLPPPSTPTSHVHGSRAVSLGDRIGPTGRRMRGQAVVNTRECASNSPALTIRPGHLCSNLDHFDAEHQGNPADVAHSDVASNSSTLWTHALRVSRQTSQAASPDVRAHCQLSTSLNGGVCTASTEGLPRDPLNSSVSPSQRTHTASPRAISEVHALRIRTRLPARATTTFSSFPPRSRVCRIPHRTPLSHNALGLSPRRLPSSHAKAIRQHGTRAVQYSAERNSSTPVSGSLSRSFACGSDDDADVSRSWIASIGFEVCEDAGMWGWAAVNASGRALRPTHPHAPYAADTLSINANFRPVPHPPPRFTTRRIAHTAVLLDPLAQTQGQPHRRGDPQQPTLTSTPPALRGLRRYTSTVRQDLVRRTGLQSHVGAHTQHSDVAITSSSQPYAKAAHTPRSPRVRRRRPTHHRARARGQLSISRRRRDVQGMRSTSACPRRGYDHRAALHAQRATELRRRPARVLTSPHLPPLHPPSPSPPPAHPRHRRVSPKASPEPTRATRQNGLHADSITSMLQLRYGANQAGCAGVSASSPLVSSRPTGRTRRLTSDAPTHTKHHGSSSDTSAGYCAESSDVGMAHGESCVCR
ncbi:hypothetical protein BDW22DRAFT_1468940 [Trametopsis cervina]|nr:hypothetical protein BDW22DRAFT_1468940 [Trametopsis cervina]